MLLSVLFPVYNSPQPLLDALDLFIEKIIGKYDLDLEIIIIVDIPMDAPFPSVQEYASKHLFIHLRKLQGDFGLERKLNVCTSAANGEYLWILGESEYVPAVDTLDEIMIQLKDAKPDMLVLESKLRSAACLAIARENWIELSTKDCRNLDLDELFLDIGYQCLIGLISEKLFKRSLLQSQNIVQDIAPFYPRFNKVYAKVANLLLMQFGYVDHTWLHSYAEFNSGTRTGLTQNSIQEVDQLEIEFHRLLMRYNGGSSAYNLLETKRSEKGYGGTFRELQRRLINPVILIDTGGKIESPDSMWIVETPKNTVPTFALVTPNFNCAPFLEQTLRSVLDQKYPKLQYVVVDGASTDGSQELIERQLDGLHAYVSEQDKGHADAISKGFALTDGEIMGWINSDDLLLPGSLAAVARLFTENPELDWITGRPTTVDEHSKNFKLHKMRRFSRAGFMAGHYKWVQQESTFWRRSLWEKAGGALDASVKYACDLDLWVRFFRYAELYTVDMPFGTFRQRPGQRSIAFNDSYENEAAQIISAERKLLPLEFKDLFSSLLTELTAPPNGEEITRREHLLMATYTPIIPITALIESQRNEIKKILDIRSARITSEHWKKDLLLADNIQRFKGKHHGQRCFVMGNGPSLNKMDLSKLDGEILFGCNSIFLLFNRVNWRPTYYTCVDSRVLPDRAVEIDKMLRDNPSIEAFFPTEIREYTGDLKRTLVRTLIPSGDGRNFTTEKRQSHDNLPFSMFSVDANKGLVQPFTVAITMLQLAVYMGFDEIYLIGCDTSYVIPENVEKEGVTSKGKLGLALTSTENNDPNHFDPTYFGKGRKWHDPQTDKMIEHYGFAKAVAESLDINILNATVGGNLEVFERVDFNNLFMQSSEEFQRIKPLTLANRINIRISAFLTPYPRLHSIAFKLAGKLKNLDY